jgi:GTP diphosphokinase / guanosine-3',5'-bis(diphosphate) 3'-diphosphatase
MNAELQGFFVEYGYFSEGDRATIARAWDFMETRKAGVTRNCGEPFMSHPLRVARILAELRLDADTIVCALLHGSMEDLGTTEDQLETAFGKNVARIVEGTSRISGLKMQNKTIQQAESIRKMFFAMVDDIRVILVRLADRLDKMRSLKNFPQETQKPIAQETIDIWAPLANRLGISSIKDELEDLSLKYLNREAFDQIKALVAAKKGERADFLERAESEIVAVASQAGIPITVNSRAKHFWSIYQKMKKRNKAADELFDLLAMRVLCDSVNECYTMLGLVHTIWKPLDGRFKDYIAMPKANGYQSLHTTVLSIEGRPLEIQIRTNEMHHVAENGIASHWLYKKGTSKEVVTADNLSIINQLKELSRNRFTDEDFLARIKQDLLGDSIYVFTPKGDIMELPAGSTAIDFAYNVHTAVGEKIVGAKADGQIITLSEPLKNTQVVEVITHPQAHPTRNQYNNAHTAKARQKIRAWLQENEPASDFEKKETSEAPQPQAQRTAHRKGSLVEEEGSGAPEFDAAVLKIRVGDTTNFMIKFAQCCKPVPPLPITGYVSRGRGIIIHRVDCPNISRIPDIANRTIPVEWEIPTVEAKDKKKKKS